MYGRTPALSSSWLSLRCSAAGAARRATFAAAASRAMLAVAVRSRCGVRLGIRVLWLGGAAALQFPGLQLAVMVGIQLVEQRVRRSGKFSVVDAAILVPVHHRRGGGLVGIHPPLIDVAGLFGIQAAIVPGVVNGELGLQPLDQFIAGQGAVMVGIEFHQEVDALIVELLDQVKADLASERKHSA